MFQLLTVHAVGQGRIGVEEGGGVGGPERAGG